MMKKLQASQEDIKSCQDSKIKVKKIKTTEISQDQFEAKCKAKQANQDSTLKKIKVSQISQEQFEAEL